MKKYISHARFSVLLTPNDLGMAGLGLAVCGPVQCPMYEFKTTSWTRHQT